MIKTKKAFLMTLAALTLAVFACFAFAFTAKPVKADSTYNVTGIGSMATDPAATHIYFYGKIDGSVKNDWNLAYSGTIKLNGEDKSATLKYINNGDNDEFYLENFGTAAENDVLTIGGDFSCESNGVTLNFENSAFVWTGKVWNFVIIYEEFGVTELGATTTAPAATNIYFYGTIDGSVKSDWNLAYTGTIKLNGEERSATLKYINKGDYDEFYLENFGTAAENDILTISGEFKCETNKVSLSFEETRFTWNGSVWCGFYEITFVNYDGTILKTAEFAAGTIPVYDGDIPEKPETVETVYVFDGWTPELSAVSGAATYTAVFKEEAREYPVRFLNYDGTELLVKDVPYGEIPVYSGEEPVKPETNDYTYVFVGWTPELTAVTGNASYTAVFEERNKEFTITFVNYDGTVLQSGSVATGTMPVYNGEEPQKADTAEFTYTFEGWQPQLTKVTEEATYTAKFTETKRKYTVEFKNEDGTVLSEREVEYGVIPQYDGEAPVKAATAQYKYTFKGWDKEIVVVTESVIYTATYEAEERSYVVTVRFTGIDLGDKEITLVYGQKVDFSQFDKEGYTFVVKDSSGTEIKELVVNGKCDITVEYSEVNNGGCKGAFDFGSVAGIISLVALSAVIVIKKRRENKTF